MFRFSMRMKTYMNLTEEKMKDLSRNVTLICSVCGNDQFETLDTKYEDMKDAPDNTRFVQ